MNIEKNQIGAAALPKADLTYDKIISCNQLAEGLPSRENIVYNRQWI